MINISDSAPMRVFIYLALVASIAATLYLLECNNASKTVSIEMTAPVTVTSAVVIQDNSFVFDISVHSVDELRKVLQRAEALISRPQSASQPANIALMLHGPEIEYFSIKKYAQYKDIVDLAAKLDAYNIVELKMCETAMKSLGVRKDDIPSFIEFVPDGELELKQLSRRGYSIM